MQQTSLTGSVLYLLVPPPLPSQLPLPWHCCCVCLLPLPLYIDCSYCLLPAAFKSCQYPLPFACCLCWSPVPFAQLAGSWQGLLQFSHVCATASMILTHRDLLPAVTISKLTHHHFATYTHGTCIHTPANAKDYSLLRLLHCSISDPFYACFHMPVSERSVAALVSYRLQVAHLSHPPPALGSLQTVTPMSA